MNEFELQCPLPLNEYPQVLLAHGGGGRLMQQLLNRLVLPALGSQDPTLAHDAAVLAAPPGRLAMTTDSYVIKPLFFPGGDIGSLAVHGTVNDLAMSGARPLYLSLGLILEEGLPMETLWRVLRSLRAAADACGVSVVTGDTKVVNRGQGDGIYLNTTGIGVVPEGVDIRPGRVQPGDAVLLSGDVGRHGIAVMACREGLEFETTIESDSAPLADPVAALVAAGIDVHCLRDLTRGGLASALNEIAVGAGAEIEIEAAAVPVAAQVRGACEILGLDPLYVACEGRMLAFVPEHEAPRALAVLGSEAVHIGRVDAGRPRVVLNSRAGAKRLLDLLSGEQLPRIC